MSRQPTVPQMERMLMELGFDLNDPEFRQRVQEVMEQAEKEVPVPEIPKELQLSPEMESVISTLHAWSRIGNLLQNVIATGILGVVINIILIIADFLRLRDVIVTFEPNPFIASIISLAMVGLYTCLAYFRAAKLYEFRGGKSYRKSLRLAWSSIKYFLGFGRHWEPDIVSPEELQYRQASQVHSLIKWVIFIVLVIHTFNVVYTTHTISPEKLYDSIGSGIVGVAVTFGLLIGLERLIEWSFARYMQFDGKEQISVDFLAKLRQQYSADVDKARQKAYANMLYQTLVLVRQEQQTALSSSTQT